MMALKSFVLITAIFSVVTSISHASDPSPLQDFCVAINDTMAHESRAEDFFSSSLNMPGNTSNQLGFAVTGVNGSEIIVVLEGILYAGFVTSTTGPNMNNKLFSKILHSGDVFVFPIGLIHFLLNVGKTKAVAFAGLSSQLSGYNIVANTLFSSHPPINDDILAKAFQVRKKIVDYIRSQFGRDNN
ncbi:hypothetical protein BC332_22150 [Capsicum chinense]|nr:hypothetical protein BC332_22150 [Capsicum chinense]